MNFSPLAESIFVENYIQLPSDELHFLFSNYSIYPILKISFGYSSRSVGGIDFKVQWNLRREIHLSLFMEPDEERIVGLHYMLT